MQLKDSLQEPEKIFFIRKNGNLTTLSEQFLIDCNKNEWTGNWGCNGGSPGAAYEESPLKLLPADSFSSFSGILEFSSLQAFQAMMFIPMKGATTHAATTLGRLLERREVM